MKEIVNQYIESYLRNEKFYSDLAKVISVDDTTKKAVVELLNSDLQVKARTQASINCTGGFYIKPSVGSFVVVNWINKKLSVIVLYSEVDAIIFQNGTNGGLTITPELKTQLDKTNNLLTALINIISGAPIPEPGNSAPSALQAALSAALTGQNLGDYNNIENDKFTH